MADTRSTSTLDLKINARQLNSLEKLLGRVFSQQTPRGFNQELGRVNKSLDEVVRQQGRIIEALAKVQRGTEAYKQLAKNLKESTTEAKGLQRALDSISATQSRMIAGAARARGTGGPGVGGRARGLPGVQAPMPGLGGMAAALGAFPVVGAIAAGSMLAAAQSYGSALRFQQARLAATPFLMPSAQMAQFTGLASRTERVAGGGGLAGRRIQTPSGAGVAGAAGLTGAELTAGGYARMGGDPYQAGAGMVTRSLLGLPGGMVTRFLSGLMAGTRAGSLATSALAEASRFAGEMVGQGSQIRTLEERALIQQQQQIQEAGRTTLAEAIGSQEQAFTAREARKSRLERALISADPAALTGLNRQRAFKQGEFTRTITERPFDEAGMRAAGLRMGFAPAQAMQMAQQMAQAAGAPVGLAGVEGGMALQRLGFAGVQQTGAAMRGMRRTGGEGTVQEVADTIAASLVTGLEGSEIGEELQAQTNFLKTQADKGIRFDLGAVEALRMGLAGQRGEQGQLISGAGLQAFRAADVARQFAGGVSEIGFRGVQGPVQQRLLEAQMGVMGRTGPTTIEDYSEALFRMQSGQDLAQLLPRFMESFRIGSAAETPFFQARIFQQALGAVGPRLGFEEIQAVSQAGMTVGAGGETTFDMAKAIAAAQQLLRAQGGLVGAEARLEDKRVGIGGAVAPAMIKLQESTLNLAAAFNNIAGDAMEKVASATERWAGLLEASSDVLELISGPGESQP